MHTQQLLNASLSIETQRLVQRFVDETLQLPLSRPVIVETAGLFATVAQRSACDEGDSRSINNLFQAVYHSMIRAQIWRPGAPLSVESWCDAVKNYLLSRRYFTARSQIPAWCESA